MHLKSTVIYLHFLLNYNALCQNCPDSLFKDFNTCIELIMLSILLTSLIDRRSVFSTSHLLCNTLDWRQLTFNCDEVLERNLSHSIVVVCFSFLSQILKKRINLLAPSNKKNYILLDQRGFQVKIV